MAFSNGKNPFMDDQNDDFWQTKSRGGASDSRYGSQFAPESGYPPPYDDDDTRGYGFKQHQMQQSMNRQLDNTQRCLASIYDSEQIGIATAEVQYTDLVYKHAHIQNARGIKFHREKHIWKETDGIN